MISASTAKKLLRDPSLILGRLRWMGLRFNMRYYDHINTHDGDAFMDEDWDNLLILDGCRYDMFEEKNNVSGDLQTKTSLGSQSWDFMQQNFVEEQFHDTVYVTSNPFVSRLGNDTFHAVVNLLDEWDSELQTVTPDAVAEAAERASTKYPHKRLIVHFMQPHYPFIGERGRQIDHKGYSKDQENSLQGKTVWGQLRNNSEKITRDEVWEAYCENLDIVLSHVQDLLDILPGKSVITADHGNLVGERLRPIPVRGYGHPPGMPMPELVNVPWLVVDADERRDVRPDPPITQEQPNEEIVNERLRALGYQE